MYYTMNTKYIDGQDFNHNTIIVKYLVMLLYYLEKPNWEEKKCRKGIGIDTNVIS